LYERLLGCCQHLGISVVPESYLMTGDGMLNAFATRFLRRYYVVLLSDVVDALDDDPEGINFYIGHELGHIDRKHIANGWWMAPAMLLPLAGNAYRRAQEYTCDQYGLACCTNSISAARALAVLAAGTKRWKLLDTESYIAQCQQTGGFWMSLNELASDYPWLCKRMAHLQDPACKLPSRHPFAWVLAFFMPRMGPGGPLVGLMMFFALIGILAAIAIPSYMDYTMRVKSVSAFQYGSAITVAAGEYIQKTDEIPANLATLNVPQPAGSELTSSIDQETAVITLNIDKNHSITYTPILDEEMKIKWTCETSLSVRAVPKGVDCEGQDKKLPDFGSLR
jgi:Tfp pilus assembly protein PilE